MSVISPVKEHGLTPEQVEFWSENGYLHLPSVFTEEEAGFLCDEAHDLLNRHLDADSGGVSFSGWGSAKKVADGPLKLFHCHNVQFQSSAFARMMVDPRLTDRMADLIGPNIQLHHTKMFIKPPEQGAPFPMHQDYPYFPHHDDTMIAAIVHLDDAPVERGCVRVAPGSHKLGPMDHINEGGHHLSTDEYPVAEATAAPAKAGDVVVFSYLTAHGSGVNVSDESRTTVLVQMRNPSDRPMTDGHVSRGQGMMLRGFDPEADAGTGVDSPSRYLRETYGG
jgi:phytanoyl-CoA hydroxylase